MARGDDSDGAELNVFIAGNGSMGKRRERDLRALGHDATAYDAWPSRGLTPDQDRAFNAAEAVVVSTPPREHARIAYWAWQRGKPCFTEADVDAIRSPHFPSATPLFCEDIARLTAAETPRPLAYTLHVGQHIDDWHPGADPATYYAYQDGVALREMIPFELIWLTRWLGSVAPTVGLRGRSAISVNVGHAGGTLGTILVDTLARPALRRLTAVGDGWQRSWEIRYTEAAYLEEMRAFVECAQGRAAWPYNMSAESSNLTVLRTIAPIG